MSTKGDNTHNPIEWAQSEYKADPSYWTDRAKNGKGLIQQIAVFVLQAVGAQK